MIQNATAMLVMIDPFIIFQFVIQLLMKDITTNITITPRNGTDQNIPILMLIEFVIGFEWRDDEVSSCHFVAVAGVLLCGALVCFSY